jgi:hypothetical protein
VGLKTNGHQAEVQRTAQTPPLGWCMRQRIVGDTRSLAASCVQEGAPGTRSLFRQTLLKTCADVFVAQDLAAFDCGPSAFRPHEPIVVNRRIARSLSRANICGSAPGSRAMRVSLACRSGDRSLSYRECTEASRRTRRRSPWQWALGDHRHRTVNNQRTMAEKGGETLCTTCSTPTR